MLSVCRTRSGSESVAIGRSPILLRRQLEHPGHQGCWPLESLDPDQPLILGCELLERLQRLGCQSARDAAALMGVQNVDTQQLRQPGQVARVPVAAAALLASSTSSGLLLTTDADLAINTCNLGLGPADRQRTASGGIHLWFRPRSRNPLTRSSYRARSRQDLEPQGTSQRPLRRRAPAAQSFYQCQVETVVRCST